MKINRRLFLGMSVSIVPFLTENAEYIIKYNDTEDYVRTYSNKNIL